MKVMNDILKKLCSRLSQMKEAVEVSLQNYCASMLSAQVQPFPGLIITINFRMTSPMY